MQDDYRDIAYGCAGVARRHNCTDAGGRATSGTVAEEVWSDCRRYESREGRGRKRQEQVFEGRVGQ